LRARREDKVRTVNESKRARVTHKLEIVEGGTSQHNEPKWESEITHRLESAETEVRTVKESEGARGTHPLEIAGKDKSGESE
jgi:hypothetical protein